MEESTSNAIRDHELLIRLEGKIDTLLNSAARLQELEILVSGMGTQIKNSCDDIDKLQTKSNAWDIINSVGIAIVAIISAITGR